jgi:hydrogenase maturation protein HypF
LNAATSLARSAEAPAERRHVRVRGQVQGVGFRPFVYRIATELGLDGWVRNDGEGVEIEVQGAAASLDALLRRLVEDAPPLSHVTAVEARAALFESGARGFSIVASGAGPMRAQATPDVGTCPDCLAELFDPADRRWRYPFVNCTQCGPRYTIIHGLPYDRPQTSMAVFPQCPACLREYTDPVNRRFHAEPNACPVCGPKLALVDFEGVALTPNPAPASGRGECSAPLSTAWGGVGGEDPIAETLSRLARGEILAIKGLGGFHLACDARNAQAVAQLRARKQREEKPFAIMVANLASLAAFVEIGEAERTLLESPLQPIVLLRKRAGCDAVLQGVAPGLAWLGAMLPYTPLQWLLFHEALGRPAGTAWMSQPQPLALVMTSANPGGEPLVIDDDEARRRLAGIADALLIHDRVIVTRCDDSVVRVVRSDEGGVKGAEGGSPDASPLSPHSQVQFIRRARGYTPQAITLAHGGPAVLACGPFLKNTICITRGDQAFVSQHIGDLDNAPTRASLDETVERLLDLLQVEPEVVAHDLHPDFHSSRYAAAFAQARGLPQIAVQHHHAHVAAVLAEHRLEGEVIGLALDGVGLGDDGGTWGGELLRAGAAGYERLGHLRELALPGGDKAAREPWRMAAAALHALGRGGEIRTRFPAQRAAGAIAMMLDGNAHTPPTSSCGRWFDAAAGLAGIRPVAAFEGQAAMLFEGLAEAHGAAAPMANGHALAQDGTLDLLPLLAALADEPDAGRAAACFHATLAQALADWVEWAGAKSGLRRVALGGGCFLNHVLGRTLRGLLAVRGFEVFEARQVPPNDGGVSLGQAWVAMNSPR